jgi:ubiquinone/menaquinone biosynthesis C-methylase UbiE
MLERMKSLGWHVEGVDVDSQAVELARRRGLKVHGGMLQSRNYPDACFDAIGMIHLIEHVHDPLELLRECYRILKPGGRLVIVTPNMKSRGHRTFGECYLPLDPPRHLHLFNPKNLGNALAGAGFTVDSLKTTARDANGIYQAYRAIKTKGRYVMGSFESDQMRRRSGLYQITEWFLLKFNPLCGEEIVLSARKGRPVQFQ